MQKQEQHNVIVNLPEKKMGEGSKQLDETGCGANKEKAGKGKEFEKVGTLGEKIREERKPPDETVFKTVFEASEVEEIGKDKDGKIKSNASPRPQVTKSCRSPIALAGRIGSLTECSQHFGLALSLGIRSKPLMV